MRSAGLDASCTIVVLHSAKVAVREQVSADIDLIGRCNCPSRRRSVAGIMRRNVNAEPSFCMPCYYRPDRGI
jgi:hypothetical protein